MNILKVNNIHDILTAKPAQFSDYIQSRKNVRRWPGFDPITFSENSNYWQESLSEVIRQNIAG